MSILLKNRVLCTTCIAITAILLLISASAAKEKKEKINNESINKIRMACLDMITEILMPNKQQRELLVRLFSDPKISEAAKEKYTRTMLEKLHLEVNTDFEDLPDYFRWAREISLTFITLSLLSEDYGVDGYYRLANVYLFPEEDRLNLLGYLCVMETVKFYTTLYSKKFERTKTKKIFLDYKNTINSILNKYDKSKTGKNESDQLVLFKKYFVKIQTILQDPGE